MPAWTIASIIFALVIIKSFRHTNDRKIILSILQIFVGIWLIIACIHSNRYKEVKYFEVYDVYGTVIITNDYNVVDLNKVFNGNPPQKGSRLLRTIYETMYLGIDFGRLKDDWEVI